MHDSFNPDCRQGILDADWQSNPYLHWLYLDFVPGILHVKPEIHRQMWGGFALAFMSLAKRRTDVKIEITQDLLFQLTRKQSVHAPQKWKKLFHKLCSAFWRITPMGRSSCL